MSATDIFVVAAGAAGVAWVNWYFFLAERGTVSAAPQDGSSASPDGRSDQAATIIVKGGYDPATIRVKAGQPVRLTFDRQETSGCSEEVVFPKFGIRRFLPAFQRTDVTLTPPTPGTYEFTCGMSMLHGRIVAE